MRKKKCPPPSSRNQKKMFASRSRASRSVASRPSPEQFPFQLVDVSDRVAAPPEPPSQPSVTLPEGPSRVELRAPRRGRRRRALVFFFRPRRRARRRSRSLLGRHRPHVSRRRDHRAWAWRVSRHVEPIVFASRLAYARDGVSDREPGIGRTLEASSDATRRVDFDPLPDELEAVARANLRELVGGDVHAAPRPVHAHERVERDREDPARVVEPERDGGVRLARGAA